MSLYSGGGKRLAGRQSGRRNNSHRGGKRLRAKRSWQWLLPVVLLVLCSVPLCSGFFKWERDPHAAQPESVDQEAVEVLPLSDSQGTSDQAEPSGDDSRTFLLSFAGDCTLGVEHSSWGKSGTFPDVVGTDYSYPFSGVQSLFLQDDFTFVNLECALTDHTVPAEKEFRFRGLPAYGQILKDGGVEAVSLANNHSLDYGKSGLTQTRQVLEDLSIAAGGDKETFLYTTERGLKIGVYTAYHIGKQEIRQAIDSLREQGAQVIVTAFHMGTEGSYTPTAWQKEICRYAAECGAHIVYNSHPHVLQPMERWGDSVILYSMGNFCFGGNRNPTDKDTAVVQVSVELQEDGSALLDEVTAIPCCVSSRSDRNDYRPTLYAPDSKEATRVLSKLDGTYQPPSVKSPSSPAAQTAEEVAVSACLPVSSQTVS